MWKASASFVDITPDHPVPLAGYANRTEAVSPVSDPIEINGVLLEGIDQRILLLSVDTLYVGPAMRDILLDAFAGELTADELFIAATHTHFAPSLDATKPGLGPVDLAYVCFVVDRLIGLVRSLLDAPRVEIELRHHWTRAPFNINRRKLPRYTRPGADRCEAGPNPKGPCDDRLRSLWLVDGQGQPLATLWNYACHPVCFPDQASVSADFPGVGRASVRAKHGPIPTLFFQGFSGDVRPRVIDPTQDLVRKILKGLRFGRFTPSEWTTWSGGIAQALMDGGGGALVEQSGVLTHTRRSLEMAHVSKNPGTLPPISLHGIQLGAIQLLGVSAEVMTAYGLAEDPTTWTISCIDHTFGYYPTDIMLAQGGYEVSGFQEGFSLAINFKPGLEAALHTVLDALKTR
ncbi:MAG: hypothetical protein ACI9QL_000922 [Candidatus Omnitrophota bacterium]|jgi:hypothetical protein